MCLATRKQVSGNALLFTNPSRRGFHEEGQLQFVSDLRPEFPVSLYFFFGGFNFIEQAFHLVLL